MKHSKLLKPFWRAALLLLLSTLPFNATAYNFIVDGIAYDINNDNTSVTVTFIKLHDNNNYTGLTTANIPATVTHNGISYSVTSIGNYAFSRCSSLTSVTIPNSVTSIGAVAFSQCSGLTSITIPKSVTSIYYTAFYRCSGLKSIIVENGNTAYDSRNNCNAIIETASNTLIQGCKSTTIPYSVTSIGNEAFAYCSGLKSISIPNSVTLIGEQAFYNCSGLTGELVIPNSVTSIGKWAFGGCSGLTSITIGNSVTSIGDWAFTYCSGLTSITIPYSVTSIGEHAFSGCSGLTSIYNHINHPTDVTLGSNVFLGVNTTNCKLYVTYGRVEEYRNADQWKDFANIIGNLEPPVIKGDVNGDGKVNVSDVTALVNMILGTIPKDLARGDINGDGNVNVSDVTALVNIILGQN